MGVSRSGRELSVKLAKVANDLDGLPRKQVETAALHVKRTILRFAPSRLRNVGKKGSRLNVRYNTGVYEGAAKALVFATGPWQIIENDTKAHKIPRQTTRTGRQRRNLRPVVIPGVGVRAWADHPGTKGKHPWAKGVRAAQPEMDRILQSPVTALLHRHF